MTDKHNVNAVSKAGHKHSLATESPSGEPWGRLPKPKGRLWGLSRTTLLEMCLRGEVKSTVIKKRHAVRGIRLIDMESLAEALNRLAATQEGGPTNG